MKNQMRPYLVFMIIVTIFWALTAVDSYSGPPVEEPLLVEPVGSSCGPNSHLEYIGEFHIDWGGPELIYKDFHLISIYSLIDPTSGVPERHLELQFVAGELPPVIGSEVSGQAPYGARLYQAKFGTHVLGIYEVKDLLYNNKKNDQPFAFPTNNAGRPDEGHPFIAFAGVETAYPVQEHGRFANVIWDYTIACEQETSSDPARWVFKAYAPAAQSGGAFDFALKTYIDGDSWKQEIIEAQTSLDYMFYTNVMVSSGGEYNLDGYLTVDEIRVIAPEIDEVVIHSANGQPWGSFDSGGINDYSDGRYNDPNRVEMTNWRFPNQYLGPNGPVPKPLVWDGWFVKNGQSYEDAFANLVSEVISRNMTEHYQIQFSSEGGFYPKVFCGPTWTITLSDDKLAYCEMWFSPNAPSFWHGPSGLPDFSGFSMTFTPTILIDPTDLPIKAYLPTILK